jgi:SAM-dependent methyltransferase
MFINQLASEWFPVMPDIHQRLLETDRPARVADIGCGSGWSSIAIAQGYPNAIVDGLDIDEASIRSAKNNAANAGVADRVSFQVRDAADPELAGTYDFACAFECIHDMANPVASLSAMRRLVDDGGTVLIADERVADVFGAPGDEIERLMYGFSVLHCLPVGMAEEPSVGTGTVMRTDIFRDYATQAGFSSVEVLPIDNVFWRFYRLTA